MGRETYTFTLNHQKLSTTLADKLEAELHEGRLPFGDYVVKAESELDDYHHKIYNRTQPLTAEEIINVLRTEPERADILHLSVPFNWLWMFYQLGDTGDDIETWLNYGYEIVYELLQKDKCWVYKNQLYKYESYNNIIFDREKRSSYSTESIGDYDLYDNLVYKNAMNYLLMLLRKLWQDGPNSQYISYYTPQQLALPTDDVRDNRLEEQTEKELQRQREHSEEKDSHEYNVAETMFFQIKEVQQRVQDYDGKIFIWDSI
jgi:hypothetical protein